MTTDTQTAPDGATRLTIDGPVARICFDRPHARNAVTWSMYEELAAICGTLRSAPDIRAAVFRGAGGRAFVAGTDIGQFVDFRSGQDGVDYERKVDAIITAVETLPMPTIAVVEGYAVGAGLALANACDHRVATTGSRFGAPIARTVGNCLSAVNVQRLARSLGETAAARILMFGQLLPAESLPALYLDIVAPESLDAHVQGLCDTLLSHAPLTVGAAKQAIARARGTFVPQDDDIVERVYASEDFREGVRAFIAHDTPQWRGR
ncbi:enoyl-CoA hydratase [Verticiella sediminum]|uniref:Enoyl-CoA hydratase n=1 Tax=Verticiella sediminum TaxID=1247510 RepID=A0A556A889_9BURK|nr:enoyl-CoA hydratase [Verticiella sediminum]TSH89095.1 enoyl-CoA hydratase [Verticiella sediminum]